MCGPWQSTCTQILPAALRPFQVILPLGKRDRQQTANALANFNGNILDLEFTPGGKLCFDASATAASSGWLQS